MRESDLEIIQIGGGLRSEQLALALRHQGIASAVLPMRWPTALELLKRRRQSRLVIVSTCAPFFSVVFTLLARLCRYQVILDHFVPLVEKYAFDGAAPARSTKIAILRLYENSLCWLPTAVLVDTNAHARLLAESSRRRPTRFVVCLPSSQLDFRTGLLTAHDPADVDSDRDQHSVLWFGYGHQRFHGVETIAEVAKELVAARSDVTVHLVAPEERFSELQNHDRVHVHGTLGATELSALLLDCTLVLGSFGDSPKGNRVVPFKFLDACAAAKPYITTHEAALSEHFGTGTYVQVDDDIASIRDTSIELIDDPGRARAVGELARATYLSTAHPAVVGSELSKAIRARCR